MEIKIHPIPIGYSRGYIIEGKGSIMIGGGSMKNVKKFSKGLERLSIKPENIQLLILSHGHFDHIRLAKGIQEATGCKIVMHHKDKDMLEKGLQRMPPGVTVRSKMISSLIKWFFVPFLHIPKATVDISLGNEGMSLSKFGIPGQILHTPGHTAGSISVVLETGDAFVGCMAMNGFPGPKRPGLPIFAENLEETKNSWRFLLKKGVKKIYPEHGDPFPAELVQETFFS